MIANLAARGRAVGSRFAWWSRWFPPAATVDADRFQGNGDSYPDHWKEFPRPWPADKVVGSEALEAALAALPDPVEWYFRPWPGRTTFTLFPWAGFVLAGAATGLIVDRARTDTMERLWTLSESLRAHDTGQRFDERSFVERHRVGNAQRSRLDVYFRHANVFSEAAGIEMGCAQQVAHRLMSGQAITALAARHVMRREDTIADFEVGETGSVA